MTPKAFIYFSANNKSVTHNISIAAAKEILKKHAYIESDVSPDLNPLTDYTGLTRIVLEIMDEETKNHVFYFFNELSPPETKSFFKDLLV
jgi:hypothetical protein